MNLSICNSHSTCFEGSTAQHFLGAGEVFFVAASISKFSQTILCKGFLCFTNVVFI